GREGGGSGRRRVRPFAACDRPGPRRPRGRDRALPPRTLRLERGRADAGGRLHPADGAAGAGLMGGLSPARVYAVLAKEFTQLRRDRLTYAMILVMPIVQLMLFGYAINADPRSLPTAVLAQDQGAFSRSVT